jgi:hypothetical protein
MSVVILGSLEHPDTQRTRMLIQNAIDNLPPDTQLVTLGGDTGVGHLVFELSKNSTLWLREHPDIREFADAAATPWTSAAELVAESLWRREYCCGRVIDNVLLVTTYLRNDAECLAMYDLAKRNGVCCEVLV